MRMISVFLREQKRYTQEELVELFCGTESVVVGILKRLKEYGILKAVKATDDQRRLSDLAENDVEIADVEAGENEYMYVFTFVGVITVEGRVLKCFPKYLLDAEKPVGELKQVIKVIEKYNNSEQIIRLFNDSADSTAFNMLAVMLWLIHDYYENGSYSNAHDIIELNGEGEIVWDKTINETFAVISENRPYYPDLYTRRHVSDDADFFKRLHECILTRCSKELNDADLLELFDITGIELSDESIEDFGDTEYILDRIYKELNVQFNTRKQLLLKTLYSYIANSSIHIDDMDCFSMFGTKSFNLVWERVCAEVFDNKLQTPLALIDLPSRLTDEYNPRMHLIDVIDHPMWFGRSGSEEYLHKAADTLIPDIISIYKENNEYKCIIFDAKYYNLQLKKDKPLRGQPGIESVTKQYLYQMAYMGFLRDHAISYFRNCFIMPSEGSEILCTGYVTMGFLQNMGLENIQIRLMPARRMYQMYLENRKMDIAELGL